jgi:hypothetical protein
VAKEYTSLGELRQDATSVAVLSPNSVRHVETIAGVPFTVTTVNVVETISGATLPATLELRQSGDGSDPSLPVVSNSRGYLAYLEPFELQRGAPVTGEYVVVGVLQGLFEQVDGQSVPTGPAAAASTTFGRVDPDATSLPSTVTVAQATASWSASR